MSTAASVSLNQPNYAAGSPPRTLRTRLERGASGSAPFTLDEALALFVPLTVEVAEVHRQGYGMYVHPSSVVEDEAGKFHISSELAAIFPTHPRDRACLPPEARPGELSDARGNVYSLGALLYELVTGQTAGPGMRRPRAINPQLPSSLETILSKALIPDRAHRPEDLFALAQALHHLASSGVVPAPPPADETHLDIDVNVSMSLLPPGEDPRPGPKLMIVAATPEKPAEPDEKAKLAALKTELENDGRPRYVVVKQGMDHGPFTAVELLQQIAAHTFAAEDELRDDVAGEQKPIGAWASFAPFAEHAQRHREIQQEKEAIVRVARAETKSLRSKAVIGASLLLLLLVGGVVAFRRYTGERRDLVTVQGDSVTNVESEGSLKPDKSKHGGRGRSGAAGGRVVAGGQSCEGAIDAYQGDQLDLSSGERKAPADLTAGQYGSYLNNGAYLNSCGIPSNMEVRICAAVQNGHAVGVTVTTTPKDPGRAGCVARYIRGISFPSRSNLDVTRTVFAAQ